MNKRSAGKVATVGSLLAEVLPALASALQTELMRSEWSYLADQVPTLRIADLHGCRDEGCASFYVGSRPRPAGHRIEGDRENIVLDETAMVIGADMVVLDVVDRIIRFVEILDCPSVRAVLWNTEPLPSKSTEP